MRCSHDTRRQHDDAAGAAQPSTAGPPQYAGGTRRPHATLALPCSGRSSPVPPPAGDGMGLGSSIEAGDGAPRPEGVPCGAAAEAAPVGCAPAPGKRARSSCSWYLRRRRRQVASPAAAYVQAHATEAATCSMASQANFTPPRHARGSADTRAARLHNPVS